VTNIVSFPAPTLIGPPERTRGYAWVHKNGRVEKALGTFWLPAAKWRELASCRPGCGRTGRSDYCFAFYIDRGHIRRNKQDSQGTVPEVSGVLTLAMWRGMISVNIFYEVLMNNSHPDSSTVRAYHHGDLRRSLIDSAVALVAEGQDWNFSLREVARRAGVSHNAPYNHFADKRDLLAEVAAVGFQMLRDRMLAAIPRIKLAQKALVKTAVVYVKFGIENPARYRLMFGSIVGSAPEDRPESLKVAGANTKAVLEEIVRRGVQQGIFYPSPNKQEELQIAVLSALSAVHGLTMMSIDGLATVPRLTAEKIAEKMVETLCNGLLRRSTNDLRSADQPIKPNETTLCGGPALFA
jgi:AcrR family transcriptional regulator